MRPRLHNLNHRILYLEVVSCLTSAEARQPSGCRCARAVVLVTGSRSADGTRGVLSDESNDVDKLARVVIALLAYTFSQRQSQLHAYQIWWKLADQLRQQTTRSWPDRFWCACITHNTVLVRPQTTDDPQRKVQCDEHGGEEESLALLAREHEEAGKDAQFEQRSWRGVRRWCLCAQERKKDLFCVQIRGNFDTSNKLTTSSSIDQQRTLDTRR